MELPAQVSAGEGLDSVNHGVYSSGVPILFPDFAAGLVFMAEHRGGAGDLSPESKLRFGLLLHSCGHLPCCEWP